MAGVYATLHAFDVAEEARALPSSVVVVPDGTPGLSDAVPGADTAMLRTTMFATDADGETISLGGGRDRPRRAGVDRSSRPDLATDTIVMESLGGR